MSLNAAHGNRKTTLNHSYAVIGLVKSRKAESLISCSANNSAYDHGAFGIMLHRGCSHMRRQLLSGR